MGTGLITYDDMVIVENEIGCPVCGGCDHNTHLLKTWVVGKTTIECNGITAFEVPYPDFLPTYSDRGSSVIILCDSEQCSHMWVEETYFNEGHAYHSTTLLSEEQVEKYNSMAHEMWRD